MLCYKKFCGVDYYLNESIRKAWDEFNDFVYYKKLKFDKFKISTSQSALSINSNYVFTIFVMWEDE